MRTPSRFFAHAVLALGLLGAGAVTLAIADETEKSPHAPQKAISSPFLDSLAGTWSTSSTAIEGGKQMKATGKASFEKAIGGTAFLQTYESDGTTPDGKAMNFHGHGVYKVSEDGKTLTLWWFCNMSPDVVRVSGPLTDSGADLAGDTPEGRIAIAMKKSDAGISFRMTMGKSEMNDTYTRTAN